MTNRADLGHFQGSSCGLETGGHMPQKIRGFRRGLLRVANVAALKGSAAQFFQKRYCACGIAKDRFVVAIQALRLSFGQQAAFGCVRLGQHVLGVDSFWQHLCNVAMTETLLQRSRVAEMAVFSAVDLGDGLMGNHQYLGFFMAVRAGNNRMRTQPLMHVFGLDKKHMRRVIGLVVKTQPAVLVTE